MRSHRNPRSSPVEMQKGAATVEDSQAASYKAKHRHTIRPSDCATRYFIQ